MHDLEIRINQVDYVGVLAQPAFSLWGEGKILLATLFAGYRPYNVKLADISGSGDGESIADQEISVRFGGVGLFRFRFDRVEARLSNYGEEDLVRFPDLVERGVASIREAASDFSLASHLLVHASHSVIAGVSSRDYFRDLAPQPNLEIGESRGHGFIFHFDIPDRAWQVQLTLDHSLSISDGIYVNYNVLVVSDRLDYQQTFMEARDLFNRCLKQVGLKIPTAK